MEGGFATDGVARETQPFATRPRAAAHRQISEKVSLWKSMKIGVHPDRAKFSLRLAAIGKSFDVHFDGELFRFINPAYSSPADIVSGEGALRASGRWNLVGLVRLSYASRTPETALLEALAHVRYYGLPLSKALPRVLVALRLRAKRVLDLRDGKIRKALILSEGLIKNLDWRAGNQNGAEAATQAWGHALGTAGFEALIVPSAADSHGANVLIFPENLLPGSQFNAVAKVNWSGN